MTIVVGDHHALVRDGVRQVLSECAPDKMVIDTANYDNTFNAIRSASDCFLVIIEPAMPGMEPIHGLDSVRDATKAPVVVLSGIEDHGTIRTMLSRGIAGFIPKRLGMKAISSALCFILGGETFVPSLLLDEPEQLPRMFGTRLTPREQQVLSLLRDGLSNKGIARRLNLSEVTIKSHLSSMFRKMGVQNRVQAVRLGF